MKSTFIFLFSCFSFLTWSQGGQQDFTFNVGSGLDYTESIEDVIIQNDGKIVAIGYFQQFAGYTCSNIVRLNSDGSVDSSFQTGTGFNAFPSHIKQQPNGKILVGGNFTTYNGDSCGHLIRINQNGTLDTGFQIDPLISNQSTLTDYFLIGDVQSNGKILIFKDSNVYRLELDGQLDTSFQLNLVNPITIIRKVKYLSDGKILLCTENSPQLVKLDSNGNQLIFNVSNLCLPNSTASFFDIEVNPINHRIYISYVESNSNLGNTYKVVALEENGQLDSILFENNSTGSGWPSIIVNGIEIQSDGKVLLQGNFSTFAGFPQRGLVRLTTNHEVDTNYFIGFGTSSFTHCFRIQPNDQVVMGGTGYNHFPTFGLFRLSACSTGRNYMLHTCDTVVEVNGESYNTMGWHRQVFINQFGCDSVETFWIQMEYFRESELHNIFTIPDFNQTCSGKVDITLFGNAPFQVKLDNGPWVSEDTGDLMYSNFSFDSLCEGAHTITTVGFCGDTMEIPLLVPTNGLNCQFTNNYVGLPVIDSLGTIQENCSIDYATITEVAIEEVWVDSNQINVIWRIQDVSGAHYDTTLFPYQSINGVYYIQVNWYCSNKSTDNFYSATESIFLMNGQSLGLGSEHNYSELQIFPNPTSGKLVLNGVGLEEKDITLISSDGKVVYETKLRPEESTVYLPQNIARGTYLLNVRGLKSNVNFHERVVLK